MDRSHDDPAQEPPHSPPRIAVIAIHGVADQAARDSAHAAATLLQHSPEAVYGPFEAATLRLQVSKPMAQYQGESPDLKFTQELVAAAEVPPDERVYETIRLSSTRREPEGKNPPREVHVFEMYWGDLSRASGSFARIFIEFYQLAFQVSSLGRETMRLAAESEPRNRLLGFTRLLRDVMDWLLTLAVPILNIGILWLAFGLLPLALKEDYLPIANALLAVLASAALSAFCWHGRGGNSWLMRLPYMIGIGTLVFWLTQGSRYYGGWLTTGSLLLAGAGVALLPLWKAYETRRNGARWFGPAVTAFAALAFAWSVIKAVPHEPSNEKLLISGALRAADWTLYMLWGAWLTLYFLQIVHVICSVIAGRGRGNTPRDRYRRRALWTGEISVFMPVILVSFLTVAFWQGVRLALPKVIPETTLEKTFYQPLNLVPGSSELLKPAKTENSQPHNNPGWGNSPLDEANGATAPDLTIAPNAKTFIDRRINQSSALLPRGAVLMALGLLVTGWGLLPAILLEVAPPGPKDPVSHKTASSRWHGRTLSAGYRGMRLIGEAIRVIIAVSTTVTIFILLFRKSLPKIPAWLEPTSELSGVNEMLAALGVAFLGLLFSSGIFGSLAFGFRAALDVALDVINWLRRDPHGQTPRARIFARYEALLRHMKSCEHRDGRTGYDAIVILAHSQGTVITADVLRFLTAQPEPPRFPPIHFFTMGCPLRQIYSLRFPHLYGWVRDKTENDAEQSRPSLNDLGVSRWWNTYRSADYVGRYLWQPEHRGDPWNTEKDPLPDDGRRREWCLGAGAHTHYWDEYGSEVGIALDKLVATAEGQRDSLSP